MERVARLLGEIKGEGRKGKERSGVGRNGIAVTS